MPKTHQPATWSRVGYEVSVSKNGEDWYLSKSGSRPMFPINKDQTAAEALKAAHAEVKRCYKDNHYVRLVKLEMNFTLCEQMDNPVTDEEKKEAIKAKALKVLDGLAVKVSLHSYIAIDSDLDISPSVVMVTMDTNKLVGRDCPQRRNYNRDAEGKVAYANALEEWMDLAKPAAEQEANKVEEVLHDSGITFRRGKDGGWPAFRLA